MVRYLGDDQVECPLCLGCGTLQSGRMCVLCTGTGAVHLDYYETTLFDMPPRRKSYSNEIWSPLLCDESTIKRMTGESE